MLETGATSRDVKPSLSRPEVLTLLENWVLSLRCYSVALKNLEEIPGVEKERHLKAILEGWSTMLQYASLLFETLLSEREVTIGHFQFRLSIPENIKGRQVRTMFLSIPLLVSHVLRQSLGSQKLTAQLRRIDADVSRTVSFLGIGLYADMKLPGYVVRLKALVKSIYGSQFLQEALLVKLRDIYIRYGIGPSEQKAFREVIIELSADAKGLRGGDRAKHIAKYSANLDKEALARLRDLRS